MSHLVVLALAFLAAGIQVGVLPELEADAMGAPLLPVALIAGWSAMRGANALWPVLVVTPLVAGSLAEERTGWFLLALLPAMVLGATVTQDWEEHRPAGLGRRLATTALVASCGTVLHAAVLAVAVGRPLLLFDASSEVLTSVAWTVMFALFLALVLWPLRPRPRGLFA